MTKSPTSAASSDDEEDDVGRMLYEIDVPFHEMDPLTLVRGCAEYSLLLGECCRAPRVVAGGAKCGSHYI